MTYTHLCPPPAGPSSHDDIQTQLAIHMSRLPPELQARVASAHVACLGPEPHQQQQQQPPVAVLVAALQHAAAAAAATLPQLHSVRASALLQALTVLELRAKLAVAEAWAVAAAGSNSSNGSNGRAGHDGLGHVPDVLTAFVEAHNTALLSLANCLAAQLDSTAAAWGYPPSSYSCSSSNRDGCRESSVWSQTERVLQGAAVLQLPAAPPLDHYLHQQLQQKGEQDAGAAAIAQLASYLDFLSRGGQSNGSGRVSEAVASVATGLQALLTAKLVQQKQQQLGGQVSRQQVLLLVRSHSELLLERLQQQVLLQVVLSVSGSDLGLICAADEQQRQPGWWQQQVALAAAELRAQQQQEQGNGGGDRLGAAAGPPDSPKELMPLGWDAARGFAANGASLGVHGMDGAEQQLNGAGEWAAVGDQGLKEDGSPEHVCSTAKKQAAVAAELLAKCRLKPWAGL